MEKGIRVSVGDKYRLQLISLLSFFEVWIEQTEQEHWKGSRCNDDELFISFYLFLRLILLTGILLLSSQKG